MGREYYEESKRLLLKLHEMHLAGTDQTPEANKVRASMEDPERHLTQAEQERMDGLSADLYMLTGEDVKEQDDSSENELAARFAQGVCKSDWDELLSVLRKSSWSGPEEVIACNRAICWDGLGDFDVSLLFAEHAVKLDPYNSDYLLALIKARQKLSLPVNPEELALAAARAGYVGPDKKEQEQAILRYSFSPSEFHLQTA